MAIPVGFPLASNVKLTPAASITRRMAARLFGIGVLSPFSKSRTVESPTPARRASSCCVQSNHARAARHCSGLMPGYIGDFCSMSTKLLDVTHLEHYILGNRNSLTYDAPTLPPLQPRKEPVPRTGVAAV